MKMKKIFCMVIAAMAVVSCCKVDNSTYFDYSNKRVTDDATAELDTLSYAVGMNIGLGLKSQPSGLTFDKEVLLAGINAEIAKEGIDYKFLDENKEDMNRFTKERVRPAAMANMRKTISGADAVPTVEMQIFNEEFTKECVSEMFGHDIAGYIFSSAYPLNMYWFRKAIDEAFEVDTKIVHDSLLRLSVWQMRGSMMAYHNDVLPKYTAEASRKWLNYVAQQRGVNMMVVEDDTLYYRVDVAGNGVKPRGLNDTISLSYDLYTRSGKLVESLAKREATVREALDKANMEAADSTKAPDMKLMMRIAQLNKQLDGVANLRMPVSKAMLKGMQYAVQNVGEGGTITAWMPSSLAYGERGNKAVSPNEAVVMVITLKEVSYGPTDEELAALEAEKRENKIDRTVPSKDKVLSRDKMPMANKVVINPENKDKKVVVKPVTK